MIKNYCDVIPTDYMGAKSNRKGLVLMEPAAGGYVTHLPHPDFKKSGIKIPIGQQGKDIAVFLLEV